MREYIEREAAIAVFGDIHPLDYNGKAYLDGIQKIPAADVRPVVHGEWIKAYPDTWTEVCSICGLRILDAHSQAKYCPNCGAMMKRGAEDG